MKHYSLPFLSLALTSFFYCQSLQQLPAPPPQKNPSIPGAPPENPSIPGAPPLQKSWQQGTVITKMLNNNLVLTHTIGTRIEGRYSESALEDFKPGSGPIEIIAPKLSGSIAYDFPNKISFQGNIDMFLKLPNNKEYPLRVVMFMDNLTAPATFDREAQVWVSTEIPAFIYQVKYSNGSTLAVDQITLENFLNTILQKAVTKWRELITVFKVDVTEQIQNIIRTGLAPEEQVTAQETVNKLQAVKTQLEQF